MTLGIKKLTIIGLSQEYIQITDALRRTGCFELSSSEDIVGTSVKPDIALKDVLNTKLSRTVFALGFYDECRREFTAATKENEKEVKKGKRSKVYGELKKEKKPLFFVRDDIDFDSLKRAVSRETEALEIIGNFEKLSTELYDLRAAQGRLRNAANELKPYLGITVPFSIIKDTANTFSLLGTVSASKLDAIKQFIIENPMVACETAAAAGTAAMYICAHNDAREPVMKLLQELNFVRCQHSFEDTAENKYRETIAELDRLYYVRIDILKEISDNSAAMKLLKIYHDYLTGELETVSARESIRETGMTFVLTGWYPEEKEQRILSAIEKTTRNIVIDTAAPSGDDVPPTYIRNNALVAPFESITNMFNAPSYKERDPNGIMSIFFFIFFGIMVGDIGYGLLLFAATFIVLRLCRLEKGTKSLVGVICICSISSILWGIIFGSLFSFSVFTPIADPAAPGMMKAIINPLNPDDTLIFLGLCLGLGVLHIITGLFMKMSALIREGKYIDALCDVGFVLMIFIGGILFASSLLKSVLTFIPGGVLDAVSLVGLIMAPAGVLGMFLTAGRANKGIIKKFVGGFGSLYGLINYVSDILSYSRLFGIGLAGGVIAMVANQLGIMVLPLPIAGPILAFVIAAVFHAFNLGLGVLGAYVHNSRLQFVEFYGKFYEGGGRIFIPMGSRTKYVRVTEPTVNE